MKKILIFCMLIFLVVLGFPVPEVYAGEVQVSLSWDAPITNVDGTPLTDLAGYNIYYGIESKNYSSTIDVKNVTTYKVAVDTAGTYYFAVTAYDITGNESDYSNEISKTINSDYIDVPSSTELNTMGNIEVIIKKADGTEVTIIVHND